jgi:hypothetical protein
MGCSDSPPSVPLRSDRLVAQQYRRLRDGDGEVSQVPGGPLRSCPALRPRWNRRALTSEDDRGARGVAVAGDFRLVPVPHSSTRSRSRRLAARRCCLPQFQRRRLPPRSRFRGSITRPVRSLSTLRSFPSRLPGRTATQDSLPAGGQPLPHGLCARLGPWWAFCFSTSLSPHPGFAWRTGTPSPSMTCARPPRRARSDCPRIKELTMAAPPRPLVRRGYHCCA